MKRGLVRAAWLVVFLSCWITSAVAEEEIVEVGGTVVRVVAPDGWCRLEPGRVSDARVVGIMREGMERIGNTFVVTYVACGELERWRSARQRTLDNYGLVAYSNGYRGFAYSGTNAAFVQEVRKMMEKVGQEYIDDLAGRAAEVMEEIVPTTELGRMTHVGIIGEDESSLYTGGTMPVETELGDRKVLAISYATTLLRKKIMFTYLYTRYHDALVFSRLLNEHKDWTARLRAVNER